MVRRYVLHVRISSTFENACVHCTLDLFFSYQILNVFRAQAAENADIRINVVPNPDLLRYVPPMYAPPTNNFRTLRSYG